MSIPQVSFGSGRTIGLVIETSRAYGRGLLRGIAEYARNRDDWSVVYEEWNLGDPAPAWMTKGACDGVIARIETLQLLESLRKLNAPIVDVRRLHRAKGIPRVAASDASIARMAADHFLERGFRRFGYCGVAGAEYSSSRRDHYVESLRERGFSAMVFQPAARVRAMTTSRREAQSPLDEKGLADWLDSLEKPIGIMACNDVRGRQVLRACRQMGIRVPDDVAVIGVDNDEILCELSIPPLSSVIQPTEQIGYEAAALLDRMMRGEPAPSADTLLEPLGVVVRLSSDVLAVEDELVVSALRFIKERACRGINVDDVLDHLASHESTRAVSRSTLDRRFADALRRSPKDEILRVRVDRARELLSRSDLTLAEIAESVGLAHTEQLSVLFKRIAGETPGEYRLRAGKRAGQGNRYHAEHAKKTTPRSFDDKKHQ